MIEVKLSKPIEVVGSDGVREEVRTLKFREPTVGDMRAMDRITGEVGKTSALLAACAGITQMEIDRMSAVDFALCAEAIAPFISGAGQPTG